MAGGLKNTKKFFSANFNASLYNKIQSMFRGAHLKLGSAETFRSSNFNTFVTFTLQAYFLEEKEWRRSENEDSRKEKNCNWIHRRPAFFILFPLFFAGYQFPRQIISELRPSFSAKNESNFPFSSPIISDFWLFFAFARGKDQRIREGKIGWFTNMKNVLKVSQFLPHEYFEFLNSLLFD